MIVAELPAYLDQLGGGDYKGLIIALFTLAAGISRPFSGKLADRSGRVPVMLIGSIVCVLVSGLYPLLVSVTGFLVLRFIHGFSTGFNPTGLSAYMADIVPDNRRGEALGIVGFSTSLAFALAPAIGSTITVHFGINAMFFTASAIGLVGGLLTFRLPESLPDKQPFKWSALKLTWQDVYEPRVKHAAITIFFSVFTFGVILTVVPDFATHLGMENKGEAYLWFMITSLFVRLLGGKLSDHFSRISVLLVSIAVLALALFLLGLVETQTQFKWAMAFLGIPNGLVSPTIFAWAIDLADSKYRGRALATIFIALEAGIGIGSLASGFVYDNDSSMFSYTFWMAGICCLIAVVYLIVVARRKSKTSNASVT